MEISLTAISFVVPISTLVNTVTDVWCSDTAVGVGTFEQIGSIARCTVITTTTLSCSKHIAQWDTVQHQLVPLQCAPVNSLMSNWTHKSAYIIWIYLASFLAVSLMPHTHSTSIRSALEVLFRNALTEFGVILTSFCLIRLKLWSCRAYFNDWLSTNRKQVLSSSWDERPFGHNIHGPNWEGCCARPFLGELPVGPRLTQCGLGRGLPPYQKHVIHRAVWPQ